MPTIGRSDSDNTIIILFILILSGDYLVIRHLVQRPRRSSSASSQKRSMFCSQTSQKVNWVSPQASGLEIDSRWGVCSLEHRSTEFVIVSVDILDYLSYWDFLNFLCSNTNIHLPKSQVLARRVVCDVPHRTKGAKRTCFGKLSTWYTSHPYFTLKLSTWPTSQSPLYQMSVLSP